MGVDEWLLGNVSYLWNLLLVTFYKTSYRSAAEVYQSVYFAVNITNIKKLNTKDFITKSEVKMLVSKYIINFKDQPR